ncbi:family 78 glycoside hydrolase catalytic domain [Reichenbachiella carrageenanivorans]|uniref:alpha-L-rhamnosidase n=1 Tax=Reichenbachiella carrageenanivorans TaxID=2979869 RepID=A0ABY6D3X2_9BACT|nr:family 78 glycoside hydrolase catalytic domain [Reichenbachiella carrageenanivorans]UXX79818.1 family 78 glycoside hydrolase catalytic domain [Reichenbachiella carrageenanivorans]
MKSIFKSCEQARLIVLLALFVIAFACKEVENSSVSGSEDALSPLSLSVEYIRHPEGLLIIDDKPEFAWEVPNSATKQTAYQIIVASTQGLIQKETGDLWDSGKVYGNQSIDVEYEGKPLNLSGTYFWKVKIWDANEVEMPFSKHQSFKTGEANGFITSANTFQIDRIKPIIFQQIGEDSYFIDFGKAAFATLVFNYQAKKADTLTVHIGEQLLDGKINRDPQRTIRHQKVEVAVNPEQSQYLLEIRPDKKNTKPRAVQLPDSFPVLMPFRYVAIEGTEGDLEAEDFTQLFYHGYWENDASYFTSSDTLLNAVWELCKYSIKATTFAGLYVDGDRERIPYEADAYLNQLSHYTTDREYAIARQTIEYFMENPTWPTEWQLHVALMFHADYMYTGNTELIEKYYDELKHKTLMELRREDGLISSAKATPEFMKKLGFTNPKDKLKDIVDWPPAQKDTGWKLATAEGERDGFVMMPINTVVNCFYHRNLEIMAEFASILNRQKEAEELSQLALKVKQTINDKLLDPTTGVYIDGEGTSHSSLHANMMAMAFDIVPIESIKSVVDFIKTRGMACSVYGSQYLLEGLYKANEWEYAMDLMTATHDRSWYNMIKMGSTMTLEAWDMKYKPNADWNHAWGATPANIIPRQLWGIRPKSPGYDTVSIRPQLETLTSSSIKVPTIRGAVKADYQLQSDETKHFVIEIPANMIGEFDLGGQAISKVILNGEILNDYQNIIPLPAGKHNLKVY